MTSPLLSPVGRWRELSDRAIFKFTGPDRVRYLNGQVSNEVALTEQAQVVPACLCAIKGKVDALVWIQARGEALYLDGELSQRDWLHMRLERYLIADDCELEDVTDEFTLFHHFTESDEGIASRRFGPHGPQGRDLLVPRGSAPDFLSRDAEMSEEEWKALEIEYRIPRHEAELEGEYFPAELGLDEWAVSFHKGCYLGQEIVSRMKSAGKTRYRLVTVRSTEALSAGEQIETVEGASGVVSRDAIALEKKSYYTLALLGRIPNSLSKAENKRVVEEINAKGLG